jgi:hypothetical protein
MYELPYRVGSKPVCSILIQNAWVNCLKEHNNQFIVGCSDGTIRYLSKECTFVYYLVNEVDRFIGH